MNLRRRSLHWRVSPISTYFNKNCRKNLEGKIPLFVYLDFQQLQQVFRYLLQIQNQCCVLVVVAHLYQMYNNIMKII